MISRKWLLMIMLLIAPSVSKSYAEEVIYWQTYDRPPGIIKSGPYKDQGFVNKVLALIIAKLPEYQHKQPTASLVRAIADIKAGKQACHPSLYMNEERRKYMYFSEPSIINPTNRIISQKANVTEQKSADVIVPRDFPENKTFALIKDRAYSDGYDKFIHSRINRENIIYISSETIETLFQLIVSNRVDFTIAYPFELSHFKMHYPVLGNKLASQRLANSPAYIMGSVACPKTPWGRQTITKINKVLKDIRSTQAYKEAMTSWWEEELENPSFHEFYEQVFLKQGSVPTLDKQ